MLELDLALFSLSGRAVGSPIVNRTRLLMAIVMVGLLHTVLYGQPLPLRAEAHRWGYLAISGLIGFILGDALLFQAFVMIGARLSMLIMALVPVFSAFLGLAVLGETLTSLEVAGIALAVGGVMWVVTERSAGQTTFKPEKGPRYYLLGVLFGLGGAIGQATGLVFSKLGLEGDFSPLSGNMIRLITATVVIWVFTLVQGQARNTFVTLGKNRAAVQHIAIGAIAGPFIGVTLSLLAIQHATWALLPR
ncbi:MAG: DMT family transporter [Anaerolineae bacterium]|nr:DMT family transporter [Anaerolineae bacterium]